MSNDWMTDARKIPDDVMDYIRRFAVHAVVDEQQSPELMAKIFHISRSSIYEWLGWYREGGDEALDTRKAPGSRPLVNEKMDRWLRRTILHSTPADHGFDTNLWTLKILAKLLKERFGVHVSLATMANHLHRLGLSCQVPQYRSNRYDPREVERFLSTKWAQIQRLAAKIGADIFFADEAGVGIMTRSGRTWGAVNSPPIVSASDRRGGYNVLSAINAELPKLYESIVETTISAKEYITFLQKIIDCHPRPVVMIVDHASFHRSQAVREFVRLHRAAIRVFFLPKHAPHVNPDEQVWNEIKHRQLGREPIIDKQDLKERLIESLRDLKFDAARILSFFQLPDTKYVLNTLNP